MKRLDGAINKLIELDSFGKRPYIESGQDVALFVKEHLSKIINDLTDLQYDLQNKNDRCANSDHTEL